MSDEQGLGGAQSGMATPSAADASELGYARALTELETILGELEASDVDVDKLADRVARATELIAVCRQRIGAARLRIDEVIRDLDGPATPPADG
jgi:exodeoxyribonuclease VII small subunit